MSEYALISVKSGRLIGRLPLLICAHLSNRIESLLKTTEGQTVEELLQPRESFKGHAVDTPWTRLQLAYFVGYAMWTYLTFGGVGSAGMEHYYAKYGFDMLTHAESMLVSPADVAIEHLFPPYSQAKNAALKLWFEY
jgi:hypothetical protein